ncbi:MAG: urease accessory protein UreD [Polyangiales bacterium]
MELERAAHPQSGAATVEVALEAGRSVVRRLRAESPLRVLTPRSVGGHAAWVVASSFGGGIVEGDSIRLDVTVRQGATALLTTQASTKVYRSADRAASQHTTLTVEANALAVSLPDHVTSFAHARFDQRAAIALADTTSSLVWLDLQSAGRSARGERWDFAHLATSLDVRRAGRLLVRDALVLNPAHGDVRARLGRFDAIGTVLILGDRFAGVRERLLDRQPPPRPSDDVVSTASPIARDGVMLRFAATDVASALAFVRARLAFVTDAIGADPWARKY